MRCFISFISFFVLTVAFSFALKAEEKSALSIFCESFRDPHDQAVCGKAQEAERRQEAERVKKDARKVEPASMREVREKEKKSAEVAEKNLKAKLRLRNLANLTGCSWDEVVVDGGALNNPIGLPRTSIRITNNTPYPGDVDTNYLGIGKAVANLCPGGSVSLYFSIRIFQWLLDNNNFIPITLVFTARPPNSAAIVEMRNIGFQTMNNQNNLQDANSWEIWRR